MVTFSEIQQYAQQIAEKFSPEKIYLFGSYAQGTQSEDSDVDILVIMDHTQKKNADQILAIDKNTDRSFPLDLLVKKPQEVKHRLSMKDMFLQAIFQEGKVLYERDCS